MLFEEQYIKELTNVLENGFEETNKRTREVVRRVPHVRFQVNLAEEIPILKSKKLFTQTATDEIMWIMQRQSNKRADINSSIWDSWTGADGTIGKAYGYQVYPELPLNSSITVKSRRKKDSKKSISRDEIQNQVMEVYDMIEAGSFEFVDVKQGKLVSTIISLWKEIMLECYVCDSGFFVDESWHNLKVFIQQFKYIEGYKRLVNNNTPLEDYTLSLSYYDSNCYALDTVVLSDLDEDEEWKDDLEHIKSEVRDEDVTVLTFERPRLEINQVSEVIRGILTDPSNRRLLINLWNIYDLPYMNLEPCCFNSDFTVIDGVLHCAVTQRSGDSCVGVPFNMYQYSILTYAIASALNLKPGIITLSIADFHIYSNQFEGARLQIDRWNALNKCIQAVKNSNGVLESLSVVVDCCDKLKDLEVDIVSDDLLKLASSKPFLNIPTGKCFYDYTLEDLKLHDYMSLPKIVYEVAV